jgi:hypothetical protein
MGHQRKRCLSHISTPIKAPPYAVHIQPSQTGPAPFNRWREVKLKG